MRGFARKGLTAAAAAIALTAVGTAAGGAAYVMSADGTSGLGRPAAPPRVTASGPVTTVVPEKEQPAALKRVVPPDFLVVADRPVSARRLGRVARLGHVRDVITADAGVVRLQGGAVTMFAVDPARFRSWTPPGTAKDVRLWTALVDGRFLVTEDVRERLGLRPAMRYPILGRTQQFVTMGGAGSLGLPGINVLVARETGRRLGLVHDIVLLVNAPGADLDRLDSGLHKLIGARSQVINLHDRHDRLPQRNAPAGRANTYLALYQQAAARCPGLSWTVLAAIGQIESGHGRDTGPSSAGALGPMQFMPATWRTYGVDGDGDGKADIMNPYDAIPAAATYLCVSGAARGAAGLVRAVWAYNHSQTYVNNVLALARAYARHYS